MFLCLNKGLSNYNEERIGQTEEKPNFHKLDVSCGGETVGEGNVHGGEDHHAGHVHLDDVSLEVSILEIVGYRVDDVHE